MKGRCGSVFKRSDERGNAWSRRAVRIRSRLADVRVSPQRLVATCWRATMRPTPIPSLRQASHMLVWCALFVSTPHAPARGSVPAETTANGTWTITDPMSTGRASHTARELPDGRVLVAGGYSLRPMATAELYDPIAGTWTRTQDMNLPRAAHTATLLPDGTVLVAGGAEDSLSAETSIRPPRAGARRQTWPCRACAIRRHA